MTWTSFGNGLYIYNSNTDTQITTGITEGSGLIDLYTNNKYLFASGAWSLIAGGGGGGETNTYSTVGMGAAWTLTKSGVDLPFRSFIMGSNKLSLTTNTNDLTIDVAEANLNIVNMGGSLGDSRLTSLAYSKLTSIPTTIVKTDQANTFAGQQNFKRTSGTGDFEIIGEFGVSDTTSDFWRIQNGTSINAAFAPIFTAQLASAQQTASLIGHHFRSAILVANDSGAIPINVIEGRRTDNTAITTRPILGIRNLNTDEFLFGLSYFDMTGNELRNATIASTVTGIVDDNIATHTSTKISITAKTLLNAQIAYKDEANIFTETQKISKDAATLLNLYKLNSTNFTQNQLDFSFNDSAAVEQVFARIGVSLENSLTTAKRSYIGFSYFNANVFARRGMFFDNKLWVGLSGNQLVLDPTNLTADRNFTFPDAAGKVALVDLAQTFTAQQLFSTGGTIPMFVRRWVNTTGSELALAYGELWNSLNANTNYGRINIRIGDNTATTETGYMDFWVRKNGTLGQYLVLDGNQLSLGLSTARVIMDASNINTTSKVILWDNLAGTPALTTGVQTITDKTMSGANNTFSNIPYSALTSVPTSFTPSAHASTHNATGSDIVDIDTIGSGTDITTNNATTSKHGLAPKGSGVATEYLNGNLQWVTPAGTGSGEANTYSNAGVGGIGITLTKSGVNLPFKSIIAASTKIAVADGGANNNVTVDVNQANLSIGWGQLTSIPSQLVRTDQTNTFGAFAQIFPSSQLKINNPANTFAYTIVAAAIAAARNITLPLLTADDTLVTAAFAQTLTNKTIAAGSNTISGIVDAHIGTHTTTKISTTTKTLLNTAIVYTDQANSFGDFAQTFKDNQLKINNPADTFAYTIVAAAIAAARNVTLPLLTADDTFVTAAFAQTLTNKTMSGASNTFSAIPWSALTSVPATFPPSAHASAHASGGGDAFTKSTILVAPSRYIENTADPTSDSGRIWINPTSEIIEYWDTLATPIIRALVNLESAQTLTNKTLSAASNTITATSVVAGSILKANGTKYDSLARGTSLQVLRTNSGATDIEWGSLDNEKVGKATASGTGAATTFNIAHGLGAVPTYAFVDCSSHAIARTWTLTTTNIVVVFASAPPSGTNNVIIYWRVIA